MRKKTTKEATPTVYLPINPNSIDDMFILKHKYEKENNLSEHIPYDKFLSQILNITDKIYFDYQTQATVSFSDIVIDNTQYIIYIGENDEAVARLKDILDNINFDYSKLSKVDAKNIENNYEQSFFNISDEMLKSLLYQLIAE